MEACQFCDVLAGRASGPAIAFEDERVVVFMGRYQPTGPGYALVIPRHHVRDLHALADDECGPVLAAVRRVSAAVAHAFGLRSTTIMQNNGRPAQSVMHLHFHVVPRWEGDGYPSTTNDEQPGEALVEQAERLRRALIELRVEEVRSAVAHHGATSLAVDELREGDLASIGWSGSKTHIATVAAALARGNEVCYLAVRAPDGNPVAIGGVDFAERPGVGTIWQLATMHELQSLGIGTRLILEAEHRIRERGIDNAVLAVEEDNARARALYERLGYVAYGTEKTGWDQERQDGTVERYETTVTLLRKSLSQADA